MNGYKIFTTFLSVFILLIPIVIAPPAGEFSVGSGSPVTGGGTGSQLHPTPSPSPTPSPTPSSGGSPSPSPTPSATPPSPTPTPTPTPSPTPTPVPVTPVKELVTQPEKVAQIIQSIKPTDLGVTVIKPENIEVTKTGVAESSTPIQAPIVESVIDKVLPSATEAPAQQALNGIKQSVSSGSSAPVSVRTTLEVFEVKEKTTNQTSYVSKVNLVLKADNDLKDVNIVEVIPKDVAASASDVTFLGEQPQILQADPIVQWQFAQVRKDETKDLSYQVNKKIETLSANTVAVAQAPEEPSKPSMTLYIIIIAALAVGAVAYIFFIKKKSDSSKKFSYRSR